MKRKNTGIIAAGDGEFHGGSSNVSKRVSKDVSKRVSIETARLVDNRRNAIIEMIRSNPYVTAKEMSENLSVVVRTIYRDLSFLQKRNIIRHEGSTYAGIWVVLEQSNIK